MGPVGKSGAFGDLFRRSFRELEMRVQSRAHGCSADCQVVKPLESLLQTLDVALQQTGPAPELLTKSKRHGILQMSAPDLHHVMEFLRLGRDRIVHALDRRN